MWNIGEEKDIVATFCRGRFPNHLPPALLTAHSMLEKKCGSTEGTSFPDPKNERAAASGP